MALRVQSLASIDTVQSSNKELSFQHIDAYRKALISRTKQRRTKAQDFRKTQRTIDFPRPQVSMAADGGNTKAHDHEEKGKGWQGAWVSWEHTIDTVATDSQETARWTRLHEQASDVFNILHEVVAPPETIDESGYVECKKRILACRFAIAASRWSEQYFASRKVKQESLVNIARVMAAGLSSINDGNASPILPDQVSAFDRINDHNTSAILPDQAPGLDGVLQSSVDASDHQDRSTTAYELVFGVERVGIDGTWMFQGTLGQGGLGHAGLWAKYDTDGRKTEVGADQYTRGCRTGAESASKQ